MNHCLLALSLAFFCTVSKAAYWDAHNLYEHLNSENSTRSAMGTAYILRTIDSGGDTYCFPKKLTTGQISSTVLKHMKTYRTYGSEDAAITVAVALSMAWPCDGVQKAKTKP